MQDIFGLLRQIVQVCSVEDKMALHSPLRFIEAFVEYISLGLLGFTVQTIKTKGLPSFDTKLFLKIN